MKHTIKLTSINTEFGAGITKGYWQYPIFGWRYVFPHSFKAYKKLANFIDSESIDIAALQEMDRFSLRSNYRDRIEDVAKAASIRYHEFFPSLKMGPFINMGTAILSKYKLSNNHRFQLSKSSRNSIINEPRYAGISDIKIAGNDVRLINIHLGTNLSGRTLQLENLVKLINGEETPTILLGDFNTDNEQELKVLDKTNLRNVSTEKTFPSWNPKRRFDYIFAGPEFKVLESYVYSKKLFSDHLPVVAKLQFNI